MTSDEEEALNTYVDALIEGTPAARQHAEHVLPRLTGLWPQVKGFDQDRSAMFDIAELRRKGQAAGDVKSREKEAAKLDGQADKKERQAREMEAEAKRLRHEAANQRNELNQANHARDTATTFASGQLAASRAATKLLEQEQKASAS